VLAKLLRDSEKVISESKEAIRNRCDRLLKTLEKFQELLREHGYTMEDVDKAFHNKIKELEKKKYIKEKEPLEKKKVYERPVGRFVTLKQSDYPVKMFVLRELYTGKKEAEVRIGYYIVSIKILRNKGKLSLMWGQFNPNIPKKDLKELIAKAERKGIL